MPAEEMPNRIQELLKSEAARRGLDYNVVGGILHAATRHHGSDLRERIRAIISEVAE